MENDKKRTCPFYGFMYSNSGFTDSSDSGCGLYTNELIPCHRKFGGSSPNWQICILNNPEINADLALVNISKNTNFFPRELWPKNNTNWEGISFEKWIAHVGYEKEL